MTRRGGEILVDQLVLHGVELAFGVPGESYLDLLDALVDSPIRFVACRHEVGAANMAEAHGKLTGRPGVCMVTRGPGATHAACGVHTAAQDSTPLLLLVGQVPRAVLGREAFQELDYRRVFGGMAKWVDQVESADEHGRRGRAGHRRRNRRSTGPRRAGAAGGRARRGLCRTKRSADLAAAAARPSAAELAHLRELLAAAGRPLLIVGEGGWSTAASEDVCVFAETNALPVAASFRCQDYVDNHSSVYCGHLTIGPDPRLARRVQEADLIVALGGRLGDITTSGYSLLDVPKPHQTARAHPSRPGTSSGRSTSPTMAIVSGLPEAAAALRALEPVEPRWAEWSVAARADYVDNLHHDAAPGRRRHG